jgi:hypothetical protein
VGWSRVSIGRGAATDVWLDWDREASRLHAVLSRIGDKWAVADDGRSRNGTFLNGERISGARRLRDGDTMRFGTTEMRYCDPGAARVPSTDRASRSRPVLSDAERLVLLALGRPFREAGRFTRPASNRQIAEELLLSVDAVESHLHALFAEFEVEDLPDDRKRARLVELALRSGVV